MKIVSKYMEAFFVLHTVFFVSLAMEKSLVSKKTKLLRGLTIQITFSNSTAYKVSQAKTV